MPPKRSPQKLLDLFANKKVVDLPTIRSALGDVSVQTTFRYLSLVPYRRSYNHNGRYYTLYRPKRFGASGLWSYEGIHFSEHGSLRNTVCRLVHEAQAGATHRELQQTLQVRVHNTLLHLLKNNEICRESLTGFFVYLHIEAQVRDAQLHKRRLMVSAAKVETEVTDAMIIAVLLELIRRPRATRADVARHLRGHAPPVTANHIDAIFRRYDLDHLGEKGGP